MRSPGSACKVVARVFTRGAARGVKIESCSADLLPYKGIDAAKKPVKLSLVAGERYIWCACGLSASQPFCDGTHAHDGLTVCRPIAFQVLKTGDYQVCMCKQTEHRPLCDGKHKEVSPVPRNTPAQGLFRVAFGDNSPVYDGVARELGYKPKGTGFQ